MCGIIGIVGKEPVAERLLDGLKRLEYRGYDSAGIATLDHGRIERRRAEGKLTNLARILHESPLAGTTGICALAADTDGADGGAGSPTDPAGAMLDQRTFAKIRDLKLDREKVNVNGGAMALGHPIGATGAILIGTMVDELERRGAKRALITMCAAGGMAPAIIIERV